jgi:hypothetical protein
VLAVIKLRTVTFTSLALVLNPLVKPESNLRRIQRFFSGFTIDPRAKPGSNLRRIQRFFSSFTINPDAFAPATLRRVVNGAEGGIVVTDCSPDPSLARPREQVATSTLAGSCRAGSWFRQCPFRRESFHQPTSTLRLHAGFTMVR